MTVAMALAENTHHSSRGQTNARAGVWGREDVPVPQMVDQPLALLAAFDVLVPEQVIKVPKMPTLSRCPRTVLSVPQTAEQLVEAPTIVFLIDVIRHPVASFACGMF